MELTEVMMVRIMRAELLARKLSHSIANNIMKDKSRVRPLKEQTEHQDRAKWRLREGRK